jgi:membrane-associated phospholipid phosphatase
MFTFEFVAVGYFVVLAALSPFSGASVRRAAGISAAALTAAGGIILATRVFPSGARVWLAHGYLAASYWLPARLVTRPPAAFEAWLRRTEPGWNLVPVARTLRVRVRHIAELAYLCCYPLVPAAFTIVYFTGSIADVNRFWTAVLSAGCVCYVSLPWLVSRPPRVLEDAGVDASRVRRVNLHVLDRLSHGWNTFPSGHVAVAFAAALSIAFVAPRAGVALLIVAIGIAIGSLTGRYHYAVDALTGILVGVGAWAIAVLLMR